MPGYNMQIFSFTFNIIITIYLLQIKMYDDDDTHVLNDWGCLERFLFLGTTSSYNPRDKHPRRENAECIDRYTLSENLFQFSSCKVTSLLYLWMEKMTHTCSLAAFIIYTFITYLFYC